MLGKAGASLFRLPQVSCRWCSQASYTSPLTKYNELVQSGELRQDAHQRSIVAQLDSLCSRLHGYEADQGGSAPATFLSKIFAPASSKQAPRGLYLHGSVGTGKTMLMDMFYFGAQVPKKRRAHFGAFMVDVHKRFMVVKDDFIRSSGEDRLRNFDALGQVADSLTAEAHLLCFDEFQVTDISNAMILRGLFTRLFENGVVVVATSNRPPDDLYMNGLQRPSFLPFIDVLKNHCDVSALNSGIDHRIVDNEGSPSIGVVYLHPIDASAMAKADTLFSALCHEEGGVVEPKTLHYYGRHLSFDRACGGVVDVTYHDMCIEPRAALDYLQMCRQFHSVVLRDVPENGLGEKGAARFVKLIDTLYDNNVRLVMTAARDPRELFNRSAMKLSPKEEAELEMLRDDLGLRQSDLTTSLFTGEEELFSYLRAESRIQHMVTNGYWESCLENNALLSSRESAPAKQSL